MPCAFAAETTDATEANEAGPDTPVLALLEVTLVAFITREVTTENDKKTGKKCLLLWRWNVISLHC